MASTENTILIYKATSPSGKSYIGISSRPLQLRKNGHRCDALKNRSSSLFHKAIRKYGFENIQWEVLEKVDSWQVAQERERFYIEKLDTYKNGYNLTLGGDGHLGFKQPEETIKKRAAGISKALKGKKFSDERKEVLSKAQIGNTNKCGTKLSDESKKKISDNQKDKIKQIVDTTTGTIYRTSREAESQTGIKRTNILRCCREKGSTAAVCRIFRFASDWDGVVVKIEQSKRIKKPYQLRVFKDTTFIGVWNSMKECAIALGISDRSISNSICLGQTLRGYSFIKEII